MDVYRKSPIPAIYTLLDFVRAPAPCLLADCPYDLSLLNKLKRVAAGHACISELESLDIRDSQNTLIVKAEFPDDILMRTGTTDEPLHWRLFQWKLWDAETLVTNSQPAESVHLANARITTDFLDSLAHPTSCLPMLRKTEKVFEMGRSKGYQLTPEVAAKIEVIEKPLIARIELASMKQLKSKKRSARPKASSDSQVSPKLRDSILRKDNYRCIFCGQNSTVTSLEVNHIIPRSLINKLNLDLALHDSSTNLCVTCFNCNRGKSDHLATEDIEYYQSLFSDSTHPNHGILVYLAKIAELQSLQPSNGSNQKT